MAKLQSHPLELRGRKRHVKTAVHADPIELSPLIRYGAGVCLGVAAFKWIKRNVRKVPVVGPIIAGVMPAILLGAVAGVTIVYGIQQGDALAVGHILVPEEHKRNAKVQQQAQGKRRCIKAAGRGQQARMSAAEANLVTTWQGSDDLAKQVQDAASTGMHVMLSAAEDVAISAQASIVAAATVAKQELEYEKYEQARAAGDIDLSREVARLLHDDQPLHIKFQREYQPTKRQLKQRLAANKTQLQR